MGNKSSVRRLAENEIIFRKHNEQITKDLEELKNLAKSEHQESLAPDMSMELHFYCECADEKCLQRILLPPKKYEELHQNKNQFIVIPGHENPEIERTVFKGSNFHVVEKFITINKSDESATELNKTNENNV